MSSSQKKAPETENIQLNRDCDDDTFARFSLLELDDRPSCPPNAPDAQIKTVLHVPVKPLAKPAHVDEGLGPEPEHEFEMSCEELDAEIEAVLEASLEQCLEEVKGMIEKYSEPAPPREEWKFIQYQPQQLRPIINAVATYEQLRRDLFQMRLAVRGQVWCSMGHHVVPKDGFKFFLENGPEERVNESGVLGLTVYRICQDCLTEIVRQQSEWSEDSGLRYRITQVYVEHGKFFFRDFGGKKRYGGWGSPLRESDKVPTMALAELKLPPRLALCLHDDNLELEEIVNERTGTYVYL